MVSAKFTEVYNKVRSISDPATPRKESGNPTNDEQLELYALAKIAKGDDFSAADKPGMFDLKGKAKYNSWKKWVEEGTSASDAEQKYIELGTKLADKYLA